MSLTQVLDEPQAEEELEPFEPVHYIWGSCTEWIAFCGDGELDWGLTEITDLSEVCVMCADVLATNSAKCPICGGSPWSHCDG